VLQLLNDNAIIEVPQMADSNERGWARFSPEVAWFVYDFFRKDLNGYEKLLFYAYYIQGFTYDEIGERVHCTLQRVEQIIKGINKRMRKRWTTKETWGDKV
jgi:hypothetical protein